jgi:protein SCO1/2
MNTKRMYLGVGLGIAGLLLLVGWRAFQQDYEFRGSLIDPPAPAADFTLQDQHQHPYTLSDQKGKVVLLFFGYTNCPDVCPVTLAHFKQIKADLGEQAGEVQFVFITVDPERDTAERLKDYLPNFDPGFIGLTGSRADLEPVWKNYGVYQARQETGSAAGYLVDHTARTYLIDRQGNWRLTYPFEMEKDAILSDVRFLIKSE